MSPAELAAHDQATAQADHDAIRASRALGRLLLWTLVTLICAVLFLTPDHHWTGCHWTIAAANTLLALRLTWTGDTP